MKKEFLFIPNGPMPLAKYSHGAKVGPIVFTSGLAAQAPGTNKVAPELVGDVAGQTRQTLEHLKNVLATAGCTFDDVIRTNIYLTNINDYQQMNAVYSEYFPKPQPECPGRMCMEIPALAQPELLVEIDMIAVCPNEEF